MQRVHLPRFLARKPVFWASIAVGLLAFLPRALTAGEFQTIDEVKWLQRSLDFSDAILDLEPSAASASTEGVVTMPGVTTMWLGTLARIGWEISGQSSSASGDEAFVHSSLGIELSQLAVAGATSILIALIVALAWRWAGGLVAVAAGLLLASEPFVVAHGSVLHTDELAALFAGAGVLALLCALGSPDRVDVGRPRALAALAGVLLAGAFLSKLSALALAPGLALIVLALVIRAKDRRTIAVAVGVVAAAAIATIVVAWPAIWADTSNQVSLIRGSADLAETSHKTVFLGEITDTPGVLYYAVAVPFRMTPWFLAGFVLLAPLAFTSRWRRHGLILLVIAVPAVVALSVASKQFDRYVLIVFPFFALLTGMGLDVLVGAIRRSRLARQKRRFTTTVLPVMGVLAGLAAATHSTVVAPWGLAYFNPLLGGSDAAESALLVGWGEGLELAGDRIAEIEAPGCDVDIAVFDAFYGYASIQSAFRCGRPVDEIAGADYLAIYVNGRQRASDEVVAFLRSTGRLVEVVRIRGIDYVEIYDVRKGRQALSGRSPAL